MKRFEIGVLSWLLVGGILGCESRSSDSNLADSGRGPRIFHVDSVAGSDVSPGTSPETPWQSLNKINAMKLLPGDVVRLKRGSAWDIGLVVKDSGTPEAPITIEAYGDENKPVQEMKSPVIENSGAGRWGAAVELKGSYIIVEGLLLRNANARGVMINEGADHNIIRHNEITNVGIGVQVFGKFNLVTRNFVHDLHMIVNDQRDPNKPRSGANDFGANCFWLENTDNELSYNRGENCVAPSFDYGRDGGFVELFGVTDRSHIHHNYAKNTDGFSEISGPGDASAYNIRMHHNVIVDVFTPVLCVHTDNPLAKIEDVRFENNTVYKLTGGGNPTIDCLKREGSPTTLLLRNNIFVSDVAIARTGAITHTNNLYSLVSGVNPGFALDSTEKLSDAGFFAAEKGDLRLAEGSAAVDAGLALGYAADYTGRAASGLPDLGAYELGSAITVFAAGEAADGVYPTMRLLVDDVPVATWTDIKGSPALRQFQTFTYNHPKTVAIDSIKVEFVNDSGTGGARNLIVDKVSLDGKNHHTEAETSYSTSCQSGYQKTEWLYCNGTVAYKSE